MKQTPRHQPGWQTRAAVAILTAALFLSACGGAEPAAIPTATTYSSTPTAGTQATATTNAEATGTAEARTVKADASGAERQYASMPPEQRNGIIKEAPPMVIDVTKKYVATIQMQNGGAIKLELDPGIAPKTVNNFVYLAQSGFYDSSTFHRVLPGFMAQGGDPTGSGMGGPGYQFEDEANSLNFDAPGVIAMANAGPNTNGSQFFITYGSPTYLNGKHTIFGKIIEGQDVLDKITPRDPDQNPTTPGDTITRIDVEPTNTATAPQPSPVPTLTPVPEPAACVAYPLNVQADDHIYGKPDALVTLIEYGDMQCPACGTLHPSLKSTMLALSDTVRLVFRHFPLTSVHDKALIAAHGTEAAALQGKFWEMHDALYEKQKDWEALPVAQITETLKTFATELGLDVAKFETDLASPEVAARVQADVKTGTTSQIQATPTLFLDGRAINPQALSSTEIITQFRAYAEQRTLDAAGKGPDVNFAKPDEVVEAGATYVMTIKTTKGDIVAEINPALAPVNVNSTLFLAQKGYYNNADVALNDPEIGAVLFGASTASGNPGYDCSLEKPATDAFAKAGVVALFGDGIRNTTQLIFTYTPTVVFADRFSVIGEVTQGLDIIKQLQAAPPPPAAGATTTDTITTTATLPPADKILSIDVTKK